MNPFDLPPAMYSKVTVTEKCWLWTAAKNAKGRPIVGIDGGSKLAYRVSYETLVGPVPDGLQLDHLCQNIRCVNPEHLEPVTAAENMRRRAASQTHCKRGHEFTAENTYHRKNRTARECVTCRYDNWVARLDRPVRTVGRPRNDAQARAA